MDDEDSGGGGGGGGGGGDVVFIDGWVGIGCAVPIHAHGLVDQKIIGWGWVGLGWGVLRACYKETASVFLSGEGWVGLDGL